MYELIIVGAGPAGLAAAVYAARKRLNTLLVSNDIGGQINTTWGIENYLGYQFIEGPELIGKFQAQVAQFPIDQKTGVRISRVEKLEGGLEAVTEEGERYRARAVVFATGKRPRRLNVPGETELAGRGVSYCAICDGPVFAGQRVAIAGGGNSAVSSALDMVKIAEHVHLISITPLTADAVLVNRMGEAKNVTVLTEHQVERVEGQGVVKAVLVKPVKGGDSQRIEVSGVFVEIGLEPNSDPVRELVKLNTRGEVAVNAFNETGVPGLFAAGDVTDVPEKQIIIAAGEGAKAVLRAHRYLQRLSS